MASTASRTARPDEILLQTRSLTKRFGGLTAVSDLDMVVRKGEISSLIGPNGAGKTTVFNVVTGIYRPDAGKVQLNGESIGGRKPHRIVARGIARTFQNIRLFPEMTCLENVMAGQHCRVGAGFWSALIHSPSQRSEERQVTAFCKSLLERVGLARFAHELAKNIAYGSQRMLEIARALASRPKLLVLDEPSSGLNPRETRELIDFLRGLAAEGLTLLIIEHDMNVVMGISDWITVMDEGRKIAEGTPEEIYNNSLVIEAYLGKEDEDESED
jgi:ABC-type branched-subunit amino acid transport system ATPase component